MSYVLEFGTHTAERAVDCEIDVFGREYGNTVQEWAAEYGPYDGQSLYLTVSTSAGHAVGAMRLIRAGAVGLKSLNDVARAPWHVDGVRSAAAAGIDVARTWDVATIAVRPGAGKRGLVSAALYHGLVQASRANGVRWVVMIMDARARRLLSIAGLATHVLPGTQPGPYLGSPTSVPLWADLPQTMDNQRRSNPEAHRLVGLGLGLDGIRIPAPTDYRLDTPAAVAAPSPA